MLNLTGKNDAWHNTYSEEYQLGDHLKGQEVREKKGVYISEWGRQLSEVSFFFLLLFSFLSFILDKVLLSSPVSF